MTGLSEVQSPTRMILNANIGVTNIIEHDVIARDMGKVTDSLFNKLKDHYGPYSSFAGLDPNKPLEDTSFTKDGANIVKAIEYASPLEDWVRRAILYVGTNIEKSAGDGTTSAMMFSCGMLKHMIATLDQIRPVNYNQLRGYWNEFVSLVEQRIKDFTLSAKDHKGAYNPEAVADLAYIQAYTSSHGNKELAEAVSKIFKNTPSDMWGKMTFGRKRYESDALFSVIASSHQYEMECDILSKTVYNRDAGKWLEYPKCTLVVLNDSIHMDDIHWNEVHKLLEESTPESPVAILGYSDYDNATYGELMSMTSAKVDGKLKHAFAVFGRKPEHLKINDFTNIQAIAGVNILEYASGEFAGRPLILKDVHLQYEFEKLSLDGLYTDTREPSEMVRERPYYTDPSKPYFREWADTLKKYIDGYEGADIGRSQQRELSSFRKMYNALVFDKQYVLVVGGNTFDNLSMYDVVDDVIRATVRSLENGMVVSNNKTLYWVVDSIARSLKTTDSGDPKRDACMKWFCTNVLTTLEMFANVVMDQLYPHGKCTIAAYNKQKSAFLLSRVFDKVSDNIFGTINYTPPFIVTRGDKFDDHDRNDFCSWWFDNVCNMLNYDNTKWWSDQSLLTFSTRKQVLRKSYSRNTMIAQPANADVVLLNRFGEIALKFILTERVIVSNSAYLNKENKQ